MEFFLFMSKTVLEVGYSFILWSMLYLEGWSSRSSYFFGVALDSRLRLKFYFLRKSYDILSTLESSLTHL